MTVPATGRVVIAGTGIAGATAAETLRKRGFAGEIVLLGADPAPPYRRPMVSKELLAASFPAEKALLRPATAWPELRIDLRTGVRVEAIDPDAARVALDDGTELGYDALLLATGGRPRTLGVPIPGAFTLRDRHDAVALRDVLARPGVEVAVVGGGLIGTEVAASAQAGGARVTILEAGPRLLDRVFPPPVSAALEQVHRARGVAVHTGVAVTGADTVSGCTRLCSADGREWIADAVVVAVGMTPNDEQARAAGLRVEDGIVVDEFCRTSVPGVYAAGDVARFPDPVHVGHVRVEHWNHAQSHGAAAAAAILGEAAPYREVPWCWTTQYGRTVQAAGRPGAGAELIVDGDPGADAFLALTLAGDRLVGAVAAGRPRELRAARTLIGTGAGLSRALLTGPIDLVSVAAAAA
ncbi:NAD(P)/FAD-dependent oxidoreductase [Nocardia sp. NPDC057353]|uniref:NAD(P)/FAD-dependent oxidoreductase n=1 Tax=Nocardia sp. NPDC057353 TaxID=3346104 RepID=UPI00362A6274